MDLSGFKITVVGLGLIGGSLAMSIKAQNPDKLWAIDRNEEILNKAVDMKVIDEGFIDGTEAIRNSDIVFIALYPKDTVDFVLNNINNFKENCIITDAAGIKANIINSIQKSLKNGIDFIGGHPMAGKETAGFNNADGSLFEGANYILTATKENKKENISLLTKIIYGMGFKDIIFMTPEEHDKAIAFTSHLPHLLAVSLITTMDTRVELKRLIGGSFRDATRVAAINGDLWSELFESNKENVIETLDCFINNLNSVKKAIQEDDVDYLQNQFKIAFAKRKEIS